MTILDGLHLFKSRRCHQSQHTSALIVVMLQQQPTSWGQGDGSARNDVAAADQSITTAIQGKEGLVIAHNRIQMIHHLSGDVGGFDTTKVNSPQKAFSGCHQ